MGFIYAVVVRYIRLREADTYAMHRNVPLWLCTSRIRRPSCMEVVMAENLLIILYSTLLKYY